MIQAERAGPERGLTGRSLVRLQPIERSGDLGIAVSAGAGSSEPCRNRDVNMVFGCASCTATFTRNRFCTALYCTLTTPLLTPEKDPPALFSPWHAETLFPIGTKAAWPVLRFRRKPRR